MSDFKSFWNNQHFKSIWNVFLHFCRKPEITFDTKSSLHEHLHRVFCIVVTLRGDWEDLKLCSHKSTFKIYLKSQILNLFEMSNILNLFEMSNILNLFEMSSSTFVWNQRSPLIQSHCFMNTCTECSGCSQIRQMVVFWLPSILFHFPWQTLQCTANADQSPSYIGL